MLGVHYGMNRQVRLAGGGEEFFSLRGVRCSGAFDGLKAGVASDLEAFEHGEKLLRQHGKFDGLADGGDGSGCGGRLSETARRREVGGA